MYIVRKQVLQFVVLTLARKDISVSCSDRVPGLNAVSRHCLIQIFPAEKDAPSDAVTRDAPFRHPASDSA
jgi:hypothetical protein